VFKVGLFFSNFDCVLPHFLDFCSGTEQELIVIQSAQGLAKVMAR